MHPLLLLVSGVSAYFLGSKLYHYFFDAHPGAILRVAATKLVPIPPGVPGYTAPPSKANENPLDIEVLVLVSGVKDGTASGQALSWHNITTGAEGSLVVNGTSFPAKAGTKVAEDVTAKYAFATAPLLPYDVATALGQDVALMIQQAGQSAMIAAHGVALSASKPGYVVLSPYQTFLDATVPGSKPIDMPAWGPKLGDVVQLSAAYLYPLPGRGAAVAATDPVSAATPMVAAGVRLTRR